MSKVAEAEDHVRKAEKYLKTSFLKWSPDYDSAGTVRSSIQCEDKIFIMMSHSIF